MGFPRAYILWIFCVLFAYSPATRAESHTLEQKSSPASSDLTESQVIFWDLNDYRNRFHPRIGQVERICLDPKGPFAVPKSSYVELSKTTAPELKREGRISSDEHDTDAFVEIVAERLKRLDPEKDSRLRILINSHGSRGCLSGNVRKQVVYEKLFRRLFGTETEPGVVPKGSRIVVDIFLDACHSATARGPLEKALIANDGKFSVPGKQNRYKNMVNLLTTATEEGVSQYDYFWDALEGSHAITPKTRSFCDEDYPWLCRLCQSPNGETNHHQLWSSYQEVKNSVKEKEILDGFMLGLKDPQKEIGIYRLGHWVKSDPSSPWREASEADRAKLGTAFFQAALSNPNEEQRTSNLRMLDSMDLAPVAELILEKLPKETDPSLRKSLIEAYRFPILSETSREKMMTYFLGSPADSPISEAVAQHVSDYWAPKSPERTEWLKARLYPKNEPNAKVRYWAAVGYLRLLGEEKATEKYADLMVSLLDDPSVEIRKLVLREMPYGNVAGFEKVLRKMMDPKHEPEPSIRKEALFKLGRNEDSPGHVELFKLGFQDPDSEVRQQAIRILPVYNKPLVEPVADLLRSHVDFTVEKDEHVRAEMLPVAWKYGLLDSNALKRISMDPSEKVLSKFVDEILNRGESELAQFKEYFQAQLNGRLTAKKSIGSNLTMAVIRTADSPVAKAVSLLESPDTRDTAAHFLRKQDTKNLVPYQSAILKHADAEQESSESVRFALSYHATMLASDPYSYAKVILSSPLYSEAEKQSVVRVASSIAFEFNKDDSRFSLEKTRPRIIDALRDSRFAHEAATQVRAHRDDPVVWKAFANYLSNPNSTADYYVWWVMPVIRDHWRSTLKLEDRDIFWRLYNFVSNYSYGNRKASKELKTITFKLRHEMDTLLPDLSEEARLLKELEKKNISKFERNERSERLRDVRSRLAK